MGQILGQHFLKNTAAIKTIIAALDLKNGDTIVEIGPGRGALTMPLINRLQVLGIRCQVIAIEKDKELGSRLQASLDLSSGLRLGFSNLEIIKGDALKILPNLSKTYNLKPNTWKLAGNIPYYITGHLLRILSELENKPTTTVLMIQKEVAERIVARPPKMNLLAAITQFWAKPEILMTLKPSDFDPPPKVDSVIILLKPITYNLKTDKERYYAFVKTIFKQPRKTLLNNLAAGMKIDKTELLEKLKTLGFNENTRPQELSVEAIQELLVANT